MLDRTRYFPQSLRGSLADSCVAIAQRQKQRLERWDAYPRESFIDRVGNRQVSSQGGKQWLDRTRVANRSKGRDGSVADTQITSQRRNERIDRTRVTDFSEGRGGGLATPALSSRSATSSGLSGGTPASSRELIDKVGNR